MAVLDDKFTLSTTPELIAKGGVKGNPTQVWLTAASAIIFIGGPTVTAADGFPVQVTTITGPFNLGPGDDLWAVASAATPTVNVLSTGQNVRVGTGD
jgi:hypothetical protein